MYEELKEKFEQSGRITIRPNVRPDVPNMGLENYGMVVFPGTNQMEPMACVEQNGVLRYLNGLDENAPDVRGIQDKEKREAKIKEIRTIVKMLEFEKHYNDLDVDDPKFWSKVQTYKPNNREFWSTITLTCDNNVIELDPVNKTEDLLKVLAIEAGGFPFVAKSKEDAQSGIKARKWFLDRQIDSATNKASTSKIKNKALAILTQIADEKPRKLFYIIKLISPNSMQIKNNTLNDIIYDMLDEHINGLGIEPNIKAAAQQFMDYTKLDMKELKIRSMIKDATFYKFIILKGDGLLYMSPENVMVGRNPSEIYEFMNNPANEDMLQVLKDKIENVWGGN